MKKIIAKIITAALLLGCFTACGAPKNSNTGAANAGQGNSASPNAGQSGSTSNNTAQADTSAKADGPRLRIVTTIFPEYDWVQNILGERAAQADVTMLLDNGVDLHSYQPTVDDIMKIADADLFIYVGGTSDSWAADALRSAVNKDMVVLNLLEVLGDRVKEEEIVEGMEHDHDADHDHDAADHDHPHDSELDEHVWLSLKNADILCGAIADALGQADPGHADTYTANADAYRAKLAALDAKYQDAVNAAARRTLLFGDRFPFRYLTDDYDIDYYAAFSGCSAETEASFETIIFLAGKTDELGLPAIMTIEGPDHRVAETIRNNTGAKNQQILTLDSMQATTSRDAAAGTTYLSIMESNLAILQEALR